MAGLNSWQIGLYSETPINIYASKCSPCFLEAGSVFQVSQLGLQFHLGFVVVVWCVCVCVCIAGNWTHDFNHARLMLSHGAIPTQRHLINSLTLTSQCKWGDLQPVPCWASMPETTPTCVHPGKDLGAGILAPAKVAPQTGQGKLRGVEGCV